MEPFAGALRSGEEVARQRTGGTARGDFVALGHYNSFAFAVDPIGRLAWESNDIDDDHVVAILSERVSDEYLADLRQRGVSYLLAGAGTSTCRSLWRRSANVSAYARSCWRGADGSTAGCCARD
jgi:hypothetical protein